MKIRKQDGPPEDLLYFDEDINLTQKQVEDVVEIFKTPLTGAYNWDYTVADDRIKKLYELGKELNWNGSIDLESLNQKKNCHMKCLKHTKISLKKRKYFLIVIILPNL